jgi:sugar/nucleoside kinase (ribokinase family)
LKLIDSFAATRLQQAFLTFDVYAKIKAVMSCDICCIGHITLDKVVTPETTVYMPGGTAYYFSHAVAALDLNYLLVTAMADGEQDAIKILQERGVDVKRLPSKHTVFFENRYSKNCDRRTQKVLQEADAFQPEQLSSFQAKIFHAGPLLAGDIAADTLKTLSGKGRLSLDVQGLLRKVEMGNVVAVDWDAKKEVLPFVHYLKASEEEMKVLTGQDDVYSGLEKLSAWGVKEAIVTLGGRGSIVYAGEKFYCIPAFEPARIEDATGCGDTYMAGYLYQRVKGADVRQAGEFAAAMATVKIAASGPFKGTREDVLNVIMHNRRHQPSEKMNYEE